MGIVILLRFISKFPIRTWSQPNGGVGVFAETTNFATEKFFPQNTNMLLGWYGRILASLLYAVLFLGWFNFCPLCANHLPFAILFYPDISK